MMSLNSDEYSALNRAKKVKYKSQKWNIPTIAISAAES